MEARSLLEQAVIPRYPDMADDLTIENTKKALYDALDIKNLIGLGSSSVNEL